MKRILLISLFALTALLTACSEEVPFTEVEVTDPVRHYYPILQGSQLDISVQLINKGDSPLVIRDIQPSCGCILSKISEDGELVVPPGQPIIISLTYDSKKNVGRVEHTIRFWGNIKPDGVAQLRFDVNVVPDANYHHDYEELYSESNGGIDLSDTADIVPGSRRGYYVDR